jgi:hypothetical protein
MFQNLGACKHWVDATFGSDCYFRMGYLTKQSAAWAVLVSSSLSDGRLVRCFPVATVCCLSVCLLGQCW